MVLAGCTASTSGSRGRDFWVGLKANGFPAPTAESADAVFVESEALLATRDSELRDDVGYGLSVAWVLKERLVSREVLSAHVARLRARMVAFDDSVLERSFAALRLSIVATADLKTPTLSDEEFASLVSASIQALEQEKDLRGREASVGWIHATAHVADLLKALAKNSRLSVADQRLIVRAVTQRLARGNAFVWGEDERLAQVLRWLSLRPDADHSALLSWLGTLPPQWKALWGDAQLDEPRYVALNNTKLTLRALLFYLDAQENPTAPIAALRQQVLETNAELL